MPGGPGGPGTKPNPQPAGDGPEPGADDTAAGEAVTGEAAAGDLVAGDLVAGPTVASEAAVGEAGTGDTAAGEAGTGDVVAGNDAAAGEVPTAPASPAAPAAPLPPTTPTQPAPTPPAPAAVAGANGKDRSTETALAAKEAAKAKGRPPPKSRAPRPAAKGQPSNNAQAKQSKAASPAASARQGAKPTAKSGAKAAGAKPGTRPTAKPSAKPTGAKAGARRGTRTVGRAGAKRAPANGGRRMSGGLVALASAAVVIVVVGIIVGIKLTSSPPAKVAGPGITPAAPDVVHAATSVPASVMNQVGLGTAATVLHPQKVAGSPAPLTSAGKPELFFFGANFCPYCATERWPMVVALSRFGTFSNLGATHSSSTDTFPNTQTFSFYGSTYSSKYLSFVSDETLTNLPNGQGSYTSLQSPTAAQLKLVKAYDAPPYTTSSNAGGIPFQDFGNRYLINGFQYNPQVLQGLSAATIAGSLSIPSSPVAQGVDASANWITASICEVTNNQPSSVCGLPVIKSAETQLAKLKAP
ncbi:MAG: DUF929 family protein [Acidimicrobiales bacterium]